MDTSSNQSEKAGGFWHGLATVLVQLGGWAVGHPDTLIAIAKAVAEAKK
jgi:hypothetical protein